MLSEAERFRFAPRHTAFPCTSAAILPKTDASAWCCSTKHGDVVGTFQPGLGSPMPSPRLANDFTPCCRSAALLSHFSMCFNMDEERVAAN